MTTLRGVPVWVLCWLVAMAAAVALRPPLPVDETRYLAVAWEMWLRGDFIVPYLNGEPYHHKPPLLFWLMNAGWSVFGVNDWWPRLVAPLFALAALWWTGRLAGRLWPEDSTARALAPVILVGAAFWAIFQTLTMFDMLLATCALAGVGGVVRAWRDGGWGGWIVTGLAIGVGVLAKGPAILLHILPVALAAPWWGPALAGGPDRPFVSWGAWYGRLIVAVLIGAAVALAWAIPAGIRGGEEYRDMIFWGQSAGRIVKSFDHARPFWWYLAVLPPLLLPWLIWPRLWRACRSAFRISDGGTRLLLAWVLPALLVFSLISGKQLHYLLPEFAPIALLFARLLSRNEDSPRRYDGWLPAGFFVLVAGFAAALSLKPDLIRLPDWFSQASPSWGLLTLLAVALVLYMARAPLSRVVPALAAATSVLVVAVHLVLSGGMSLAFDLRPIAKALKTFEDEGRPLANFGYYHGQYQFLGRLQKPMTVLGLDRTFTNNFVATADNAVIAAYYYVDELPDFPADVKPLGIHRFRDLHVYFWPVEVFRRYPRIGDRS